MQTGRSLNKGKGKATSGPSRASKPKSGPQNTIYKIQWFRAPEIFERLEGYTTSYRDVQACEELGMECTQQNSYHSIDELQVAKAIITEKAEMEYKQTRKNADIPTKEEIAMYWITRHGVLDKVGSENKETILTLGRKFF
jgi:hypothetical protein